MPSVEVTILFGDCLTTTRLPVREQTLALSISSWNEVDREVHNLAGKHLDTLFLAGLLT